MWIITNKGHLSIVAHNDQVEFKNVFVIRARNKEAFDGFFGQERVMETPDADYRFRVFCPRGEMNRFVQEQLNDIDYPNFKNSIKDKGVKSMASSIWQIAYSFQENRYGRQQSDWYTNYRDQRGSTSFVRYYDQGYYESVFNGDDDPADDIEKEYLGVERYQDEDFDDGYEIYEEETLAEYVGMDMSEEDKKFLDKFL